MVAFDCVMRRTKKKNQYSMQQRWKNSNRLNWRFVSFLAMNRASLVKDWSQYTHHQWGICATNQGVHQKIQSPEFHLVKNRKKLHGRIRRYVLSFRLFKNLLQTCSKWTNPLIQFQDFIEFLPGLRQRRSKLFVRGPWTL